MLFILSILIAVVAFIAWRAAARKVKENNLSFRALATLALIAFLFFTVVALSQFFTQIPAGHVGVVDFFGIVSDRTLPPGINPVNPLATVHEFSMQTHEHKETMEVLSREGLTIGLEISVLYRLNPDSAARVYQTIAGGDYETIVLIPQFRSISRAVTASFQASALYSTERERLGMAVQEELARTVAPRGVIVETTPLRNVALPTQLTEAIEQKQRADQESTADGVRAAEGTAGSGPQADRGKGYRRLPDDRCGGDQRAAAAVEGDRSDGEDRQSPNTKVVIVGAGKDGLPIILDTK